MREGEADDRPALDARRLTLNRVSMQCEAATRALASVHGLTTREVCVVSHAIGSLCPVLHLARDAPCGRKRRVIASPWLAAAARQSACDESSNASVSKRPWACPPQVVCHVVPGERAKDSGKERKSVKANGRELIALAYSAYCFGTLSTAAARQSEAAAHCRLLRARRGATRVPWHTSC